MGKTQEGRAWLATVRNNQFCATQSDRFLASTQESSSNWAQQIPSEQGEIQIRSAPAGSNSKSATALANQVAHRLGLGTSKWTPLPHTGIAVRQRPASESELVDLHRELVSERVQLGRQTSGAIFSNTRSYVSAVIMRFIMRHITETTLNVPLESLMAHISLLDHDHLIIGQAAATWPNGLEFRRACTCNPDKCTHVVKDKIMPQRMIQTDLTQLTKRQIAQLARQQYNSVSVEDLEIYRKEFLRGQPRRIMLGTDSGVELELKICSIQDYADSGYRWINDLESQYTEALIGDERVRNEYLFDQAKATAMRQYGHFVNAIYFDGQLSATSAKEQQEAIEETLSALSADNALRSNFTQQVAKYIDDTTISVVGIPSYVCPACGGEEKISDSSPRFADIIPVDVTKAFFTLLQQKTEIIRVTR
jgi:hypothetical protein